ncbi:unnamed protein product [Penicillium bialowiezense]
MAIHAVGQTCHFIKLYAAGSFFVGCCSPEEKARARTCPAFPQLYALFHLRKMSLPPPTPSQPSPPSSYPTTTMTDNRLQELEQKCEALSELCKKQASEIARLNVETKNMQQQIDTCSSWAQEELDKISSRLDAAVSTQDDLSAKLNFCLPRIWNKNGTCFVEEERRQTALLEEALEELQKEQAAQRILLLRLKIGLTIAYPDHPLSLHRVAQEDEMAPGITTPGVPPFLPVLSSAQKRIPPISPTAPAAPALANQKSVHLSLKRGASRPIMEANERSVVSEEPNKRWNFGFRPRRSTAPSSSSSPLAESESRQRQGSETASPIDPKYGNPVATIHPAFRSASNPAVPPAAAAPKSPGSNASRSSSVQTVIHIPAVRSASGDSGGVFVSHDTGENDDTMETVKEVVSLPGSEDPSPTESWKSAEDGGPSLPREED